MQNPLAALLPIAPASEAISTAVLNAVGDGSFGETFVEVVSTSEPVSKPDETVAVTAATSMAWGGFFLTTPVLPTPEESLPVQDAGLISAEVPTESLQISAPPETADSTPDLAAQQPTAPPEATALPALKAGDISSLPDAEPGPVEVMSKADGPWAGTGLAAPTLPDSGKATEAKAAESLAPMPRPEPAIAPLPVGPAEEIPQKVATVEPGRPTVVQAISEAALSPVEPEGQATRAEVPTTDAPHLRGNSVAVAEGVAQVQRAEPQPAQVSRLPTKSEATGAGPSDPTVPAHETLQGSVMQDTAEAIPTGVPVPEATPQSSQIDQAPPSVDPSNDLPADPGKDMVSRVVSVWERFFSDGSASAPTVSGPPSGSIATAIVQSPVAPAIALAASPRSEKEPGPSIDRVTPAAESQTARPSGPNLPSAAMWSTQLLGDLLSNALVSFADWQGDLSVTDQRPELSLSSLPVLSGGPSPGAPTATVGSPHLPVPYVAAQIASVLVRNDKNMSELALSPEELGKVRLRMEPDSANPDRMVIVISVERPETLDLFRRHAGELAEAIRNAGYSGADISFGQNTQDNGSGHRREPTSAGPGSPFEEISTVETARPHALGASLDLRL